MSPLRICDFGDGLVALGGFLSNNHSIAEVKTHQSYRIASYGECDSYITDTDHVTFPSCLPKGTAVVSGPRISCDSFIFELVISQNSPGVAFHNIHRQFEA